MYVYENCSRDYLQFTIRISGWIYDDGDVFKSMSWVIWPSLLDGDSCSSS